MKKNKNAGNKPYRRPASQKDIAEKAGLSQSSVARALANHPSIPKATCERVKKIAQSLGYRQRPYIAAWMRQVKRAKPMSRVGTFILLDFPPLADPSANELFTKQMVQGIMKRADSYGFGLRRVFLKGDSKKEVDTAFKRFVAQGVAGILLTAKAQRYLHLFDEWTDSFAWVAIGNPLNDSGPHYVCNDQFLSAQLAATQLKEMEFEKIAFVTNHGLEWHAQRRFSFGFLSAIQPALETGSNHLKKRNIFCASAKHIRLLKDYLKRVKPEVVLSVASTEYQWIQGFGIKIPDDMSFACLDTSATESELSGIDQQYSKLGETAVSVLMNLLNRNQRGFPESAEATMIQGIWVSGKTLKKK